LGWDKVRGRDKVLDKVLDKVGRGLGLDKVEKKLVL